VLDPAFTLVLALAFGVIAQAGARQLRVPAIVLLLASGVLLGPDVLGWIRPAALGEGLFYLVHLAVAVILFEGGLSLEISRLRREQQAIRRLITVGTVVTLAGGAFAAARLLDWPPRLSLLFGSLVVVTGPTVVGPLISELRLRPRIASLLEAEGVLIDPIGAILAVLALDIVLAPGVEAIGSGATGLVLRAGFGAAAGAVGGVAIAFVLRSRLLVPQGLENILTLSLVLLLFEACEHYAAESGLLAVTIAGVVVGNLPSHVDRELREFKDQLTLLFIGLLFVLLAAAVRLEDVRALGTAGWLVVAALILVVRPLSVLVSTLGTGLSWRERLLAAWVAPRGIVAAAVASTAAAALDRHGMAGGAELRALVFLTIAGTVVQAGFTALPVAWLLGLRLPGRDRVAILGAKGLGLHLGLALSRADVDVVLIDSNPQNCRRAQEKGLTVVFGDAIVDRTLQRARIESVGTVIGTTSNDELNGLFVSRARELFDVPRGWVALSRLDKGLSADVVRGSEAHVLFEGPHDVERWDVRDRHSELVIEHRRYEPPAEDEAERPELARSGERFVFLCVQRGKQTLPMYASLEPREGDVAAVAIHVPELDRVDDELRAAGWVREEPPD
jgi:NhaP-type Na+/H+ or K+/H+ antiporter